MRTVELESEWRFIDSRTGVFATSQGVLCAAFGIFEKLAKRFLDSSDDPCNVFLILCWSNSLESVLKKNIR